MGYKFSDVIVCRMEDDVLRGVVLHYPPFMEDCAVRSELDRLFQIVTDEKDDFSELVLQFEQFILKEAPSARRRFRPNRWSFASSSSFREVAAYCGCIAQDF